MDGTAAMQSNWGQVGSSADAEHTQKRGVEYYNLARDSDEEGSVCSYCLSGGVHHEECPSTKTYGTGTQSRSRSLDQPRLSQGKKLRKVVTQSGGIIHHNAAQQLHGTAGATEPTADQNAMADDTNDPVDK